MEKAQVPDTETDLETKRRKREEVGRREKSSDPDAKETNTEGKIAQIKEISANKINRKNREEVIRIIEIRGKTTIKDGDWGMDGD